MFNQDEEIPKYPKELVDEWAKTVLVEGRPLEGLCQLIEIKLGFNVTIDEMIRLPDCYFKALGFRHIYRNEYLLLTGVC